MYVVYSFDCYLHCDLWKGFIMELSVDKLQGKIFALCSPNASGIKVRDADRWRQVLKTCVVKRSDRLHDTLKRILQKHNCFYIPIPVKKHIKQDYINARLFRNHNNRENGVFYPEETLYLHPQP